MSREKELEEIIENQKLEIEKLKREVNGLFSFFSDLEVDVASQEIKECNSSNQYLSELLDNYLAGGKHRTKLKAAEDLGISQGRLYDLLTGARSMTKGHLEAIKDVLELTDKEYDTLAELAESDRKKKKHIKQKITDKVSKQTSEKRNKLQDLKIKGKNRIDSWVHYAVLSIFDMNNLVNTRDWISDQISVPRDLLDPAINSLIEMGQLTETDGGLERTSVRGSMSGATEEEQKANFQRLTLGQIEKATEVYKELNIPFENQEKAGFGGLFIAGDKERVKKAERMMHDSLVKIAKYLAQEKCNNLYSITYQLAPITKE